MMDHTSRRQAVRLVISTSWNAGRSKSAPATDPHVGTGTGTLPSSDPVPHYSCSEPAKDFRENAKLVKLTTIKGVQRIFAAQGWGNVMGEGKQDALQVDFDGQVRLEFHGAKVTSDAGLLAYRDLDEALGLTAEVEESGIHDPRTGRNTRHTVMAMVRQSVYRRLADYEGITDASRKTLFSPTAGSSLEAAGCYSTVTLLARLRGRSTSQPRSTAM
jgi:hypothetical protein